MPTTAESQDQAVAIYDTLVAPKFVAPFSRLLLQGIPEGLKGQVLQLGCGTGTGTIDILSKIDQGGRVIAVDRNAALLDLARRRTANAIGKRVFFKQESGERLSFGSQVFDYVTGNLILEGAQSESAVLAEMTRVLRPGGTFVLTKALAGTFEEVLDMLEELTVRYELPGIERRLEQLSYRYPTPEVLENVVRQHGLTDLSVTWEEFHLSYHSAREMFEDPVIRLVAYPEWRWVAMGEASKEQKLMAEVEQALSTYFGRHPFSLTVRAGLVVGKKA